jgi:hypothetical protein
MSDVPREVFDRDIAWPEPRSEPTEEQSHPDLIPDLVDGPFTYWVKRLRIEPPPDADSEGGEAE